MRKKTTKQVVIPMEAHHKLSILARGWQLDTRTPESTLASRIIEDYLNSHTEEIEFFKIQLDELKRKTEEKFGTTLD